MDRVASERRLVLIVGTESRKRAEVAMKLISHGRSVVLCSGPPGCPLLRDEPCVLNRAVDVAVIMPATAKAPDVASGLDLCATSARSCFRPDAARPSSVNPDDIVDGVDRLLDAGV